MKYHKTVVNSLFGNKSQLKLNLFYAPGYENHVVKTGNKKQIHSTNVSIGMHFNKRLKIKLIFLHTNTDYIENE